MGNWISDQLIDSWATHLKSAFSHQKIDFSVLPSQDSQSIALAYLIWQKKQISSSPRQVLKAKGFSCPEYLQDRLNEIEQSFSAGFDINGYLSHNLRNLSKHDYLLYDWGIHHLHFDDRYCSGFSKKQRSSELLFVMVRPSEVYLLAVQDHGAFADVNLLEVIDKNWPELTSFYHVGHDAELSVPITQLDRLRLRKAGINTPVVLQNGNLLMSMMIGGGIASSGDSAEAVHDLLNLLRQFDLVGEYLEHCFSDLENPINHLFSRCSEFQLCQAANLVGDATYWGVIDAVTNIGATFDSILNIAYIWESEGVQRNAK